VTGRLADIKARLDTVDQLDTVITAMRGIAAVRARHARQQIDGIRTYARTIGTAIGEALALLPEPPSAAARSGAPADVVIALTAEQGFAGAFSARVLARAGAHLARGGTDGGTAGGTELMLIGDRGLMLAAEQGLDVGWSVPMAAHVDEIPALADRIAGALYARLAAGRALHVSLIHSQPDSSGAATVTEHALLPFDYSRFPGGKRALPPLVSLPPDRLAGRLAEEHVFAELCAALMLSFAAENEARMRAMISAHGNVQRTRESLLSAFHRLRQEEITVEIVELAAGRAARPRHHGPAGIR
jgi:F-type H+-transporting ATPase subunit gamma